MDADREPLLARASWSRRRGPFRHTPHRVWAEAASSCAWSSSASDADESSENEHENEHRANTAVNPRATFAPDSLRRRAQSSRRVKRTMAVAPLSSTRPPLQSLSARSLHDKSRIAASHVNADALPDLDVFTLEVSRQNKLVALFFWQRKTLAKYLAAWQWIVFSVDRQTAQGYQRKSERNAPIDLHRQDGTRARRSTRSHAHVLLRNTLARHHHDGDSSAKLESTSFTCLPRRTERVSARRIDISAQRERLQAIRSEFNSLAASGTRGKPDVDTTTTIITPTATAIEAGSSQSTLSTATTSRRVFRERMGTMYRAFTAWRHALRLLQAERWQREEAARGWHTRQQKRDILRVLQLNMRVVHDQRWRTDQARRLSDVHVCQRALHHWLLATRWRSVVARLRHALQRTHLSHCTHTWRQYVATNRKIAHHRQQRQHRCRHDCLQRWRAFSTHQRAKSATHQAMALYYEGTLLRHLYRQWRAQVFAANALYVSAQRAMERLRVRNTVHRWRGFVATQHTHRYRRLQADYRSFQSSLRRSWCHWQRLHRHCQHKRYMQLKSVEHFTLRLQRSVVCHWRASTVEQQETRARIIRMRSWYHHRAKRHIVRIWRGRLVLHQQLLQFQERQRQRTRQQYLHAWQQLTAYTVQLDSKRAFIWTRYTQALTRRTLRYWVSAKIQQSTTRLIQHRRQQQTRQAHFQKWRRLTCRHIRWRVLVVNHRAHAEQRRVHYALVRWRGVVLRQRCLRRLVRLFRTKQTRKQLKHCWQCLRWSRSVKQLTQMIYTRYQRNAWRQWLQYTLQRRQAIMDRHRSIHLFLHTRYMRGLYQWRTWVCYQRKKRRALWTAIQHVVKRTRRIHLLAWCQATMQCRQRREFRMDRARQRHFRWQWQVLHHWHAYARARHHQRVRVYRMRLCVDSTRLRTVFHTWWRYYSYRRDRTALRLRAVETYQHRLMGNVLRGWHTIASQLKVIYRCQRQWRKNHVQTAMAQSVIQWQAFTAQQQTFRRDQVLAVSFHHDYLLLTVFHGWQGHVLTLLVCRARANTLMEWVHVRRRRQSIATWRAYTASIRANAQFHTQAIRFQMMRGIRVWQRTTLHRRQARHRLRVLQRHRQDQHLRRVVTTWRHAVVRIRTFQRVLQCVFQVELASCVYRRVWTCWRRYQSGQTLQSRAEAWYHRHLLGRVCGHWRGIVTFHRRLAHNIVVARGCLQHNLLRHAFTRWRVDFLAHRLYARERNALGRRHHQCMQYRRVLHRFHTFVSRRRAIRHAIHWHDTRVMRHTFTTWTRFLTARYLRNVQHGMAVAAWTSRRVSQSFCQWKRVVTLAIQGKQTACHALREYYGARRVWRAWQHVWLGHQRCQRWIVIRQARWLRRQFTHWRWVTQQQRDLRLQVDCAVQHMDRVVCLRVWRQWRSWALYRRERHQRSRLARQFYRVVVGMTPTLLAWQEYTQYRRQIAQNRRLADQFAQRSRLVESFHRWAGYYTDQQQRRHDDHVIQTRMQRYVLRTGLQRWTRYASRHQQLTSNSTRAMAFYRHRRVGLAVERMLRHASAKKQQRDGDQRGASLNRMRVLEQCMTRWARYRDWRRQHRHLVRMFTTNRVSEYFHLWSRVTRYRQWRTQRKAMATQWLAMKRQRWAWQHWRCVQEERRRWKQAIQWHTHMVARQWLRQWWHRACLQRRLQNWLRSHGRFSLEARLFDWKRWFRTKREQQARVREAIAFHHDRYLQTCWCSWMQWVMKRQRDARTIQSAIAFQQRFCQLKYLVAWHSASRWRSRRRCGWSRARVFHVQIVLQRHLAAWRRQHQAHRALQMRGIATSQVLALIRRRRVVSILHEKVVRIRRHRERSRQARRLCETRLQTRAWRSLQTWWRLARAQRQRYAMAIASRAVYTQRLHIRAWHRYASAMQVLRVSLARFRARYFENVVETCLRTWRALLVLKKRLRGLHARCQRSRILQVLCGWRAWTETSRRHTLVVRHACARRQRRMRAQVLLQWEVASTDQWLQRCLVEMHGSDRAERAKVRAVALWKRRLPPHGRRRRIRLGSVFHAWHMAVTHQRQQEKD